MNKDYYKILGISQAATEPEIKKAYRLLAMKFHPDKNSDDPDAGNRFKDVQEAYEALSHQGNRAAYNQQRWYRQSSRKKQDDPPVTSYTLLHKCKALNRYISTLNSFHINRKALNHYILSIVSEPNLQVLTSENDRDANNLIIQELLQSSFSLPYSNIQQICGTLSRLAGNDRTSIEKINRYLQHKRISHYYRRYLPLAVLVISMLICLLIYLVSNK